VVNVTGMQSPRPRDIQTAALATRPQQHSTTHTVTSPDGESADYDPDPACATGIAARSTPLIDRQHAELAEPATMSPAVVLETSSDPQYRTTCSLMGQ